MTPYMAEPEEFVTVHEGSLEFEEAVNAMAEECFLYSYQGIFYNMPSQRDLEPPFYCVTQGRYIGVFPSYIWDGVKLELRTPGNHVATYFTVRSPVLGEQKVHCAIRSLVDISVPALRRHCCLDIIAGEKFIPALIMSVCGIVFATRTVNRRNQQRMSTDPTYAVGSSEAGTSSIQTIYCEVTSRVPKKRKKKPKLNVYHSVPVPSRQHTEYQAHQDGSITYTLKCLKPPKNAQATINNRTRATLTLHDAAPLSIPEPLDDLPLDVSLDFLGQQRRKRAAGDHPLLMWLKHRELFLQEMIRLEGRCNRLEMERSILRANLSENPGPSDPSVTFHVEPWLRMCQKALESWPATLAGVCKIQLAGPYAYRMYNTAGRMVVASFMPARYRIELASWLA
ncbi:hypothetical protein C8R48DRAFT_679666 [Suillus tomentosus]|nr:hypothetical protein C8R48DRAFT_679666 [Suillus tomentosus]